jgi:AbrB family looped-hinge helix DNA binding protein
MSDPHQQVCLDRLFYGSVTVGERGQIVIPLEARTELGFKHGDKLLVLRDPHCKGIMVAKLDDFRSLLERFAQVMEEADRSGEEQE